MKKILLFTVASFIGVASFAQQQIGNGDMEAWANNDEPDNWNSFLTASGTWSIFANDQCDASSDVRPGSTGVSSCRIFSSMVLTTLANGNVTLGRIEMGSTSPTDPDNYNYTITSNPEFSQAITDTPDSIVFWVKYVPGGGTVGNARMKATLHTDYDYRDPEDGASAAEVVATAVENFPETGGNWERHAVKFNYTGPASNNAYLLVTFTTNETGGQGNDNDQVWIDDVELIYNPAGINEISDSDVVVSMNNSSNTIAIDAPFILNGTYEIYNTTGQSVQSGDVSSKITFDQVPGIYFVHINETNRTYKFEIIKN